MDYVILQSLLTRILIFPLFPTVLMVIFIRTLPENGLLLNYSLLGVLSTKRGSISACAHLPNSRTSIGTGALLVTACNCRLCNHWRVNWEFLNVCPSLAGSLVKHWQQIIFGPICSCFPRGMKGCQMPYSKLWLVDCLWPRPEIRGTRKSLWVVGPDLWFIP